jgi:phage terminase large subunit-like protein
VASKKDINSNIRPIKERDSQRIDPFMAVLNGYAVLKSEYLEKKIRRYIEMEQDDGNI